MAKPAVTLRNTKGEALNYTELDTNFANLRDATVSLTAGSGGTQVTTDLNGNITLVAGSNVTLSGNNTAKTLTINANLTQLTQDLNVNGFKIISTSNGNIVLEPNGTGKTIVNNVNYRETVFNIGTTSGTITPNVTNGNVQSITLNGNITFNAFASPVAGQSLTLIINTNGTGRTLTSTMKFARADKAISTTSTIDVITVYYDGTQYLASISKGFA
jgi:hypothetical protein